MASPRSTLSDGKRKLYMPVLPVKTDRGGNLEYLHLVSLRFVTCNMSSQKISSETQIGSALGSARDNFRKHVPRTFL